MGENHPQILPTQRNERKKAYSERAKQDPNLPPTRQHRIQLYIRNIEQGFNLVFSTGPGRHSIYCGIYLTQSPLSNGSYHKHVGGIHIT
jgi:hypothetical protein